MAPEERDRDEIRRRIKSSSGGEVVPGLEAEEEASAEASQRPRPRGRIGGVGRAEPGAGEAARRPPAGDEGDEGDEGREGGGTPGS
jgi:hypothetical protein